MFVTVLHLLSGDLVRQLWRACAWVYILTASVFWFPSCREQCHSGAGARRGRQSCGKALNIVQ